MQNMMMALFLGLCLIITYVKPDEMTTMDKWLIFLFALNGIIGAIDILIKGFKKS